MSDLKWDKEFAMEQAADDEELLQELIEIFKKSCSDDYQTLKKGVAQRDPDISCAAAHSIKGAAASLGVEGIRELAGEIEDDCRKGSLAIAENRIDELNELLEKLKNI